MASKFTDPDSALKRLQEIEHIPKNVEISQTKNPAGI